MIKRILDALFTSIILVLAIPTVLILVSWKAIPGDRLYSLKTGLEDTVLLIFSGTPLVPEVSMKFTDRRFNEATILLAKKGSTVGYDLLVAEAQQTQSYISRKKDGQSGTEFAQNIEVYKKEIEKKKAEVAATIPISVRSNNIVPSERSVTVNVPETSVSQSTGQTVIITRPERVVIREEDPKEIWQKLDDTENKLEEIQREVENEKEKDKEKSGGNNQGDKESSEKDKRKDD